MDVNVKLRNSDFFGASHGRCVQKVSAQSLQAFSHLGPSKVLMKSGVKLWRSFGQQDVGGSQN